MVARLEKNPSRESLPPDAVTDEIEGLHYPIIKWCKEQVPAVPYIWSRPDKAATIGRGAPDFTIFYKGRCLLIECKSKTGTVSTDQIVWKIRAADQSFTVHVIRSMSEFFALVNPPP